MNKMGKDLYTFAFICIKWYDASWGAVAEKEREKYTYSKWDKDIRDTAAGRGVETEGIYGKMVRDLMFEEKRLRINYRIGISTIQASGYSLSLSFLPYTYFLIPSTYPFLFCPFHPRIPFPAPTIFPLLTPISFHFLHFILPFQ